MVITAPQPGSFRSHTLDNGLKVVLVPDHSLPLVALNLWYHVGSKNEAPGKTGFAHLFEHMLFQGSANVSTNGHFQWVQKVGGVANGSAWYDRTNYYETLPAHQLEMGLWLESDRMGFLLETMTSEKLENQRDVVMNERRQTVDNRPYGRAFERLHEMLYPLPHPYHWPVIGYMEDIEAATQSDVEDFFTAWYGPNNTVLTLVGDIDEDRALAQVEKWFGPLPRRELPSRPQGPIHSLSEAVAEVMEDQVPLTRLYLAYSTPPFGHEDWFALNLLSAYLTTGKSSPLYRELVWEREMAQNASAFILPTEVSATFGFVSSLSPGTDANAVEAIFRQALRAIGEGHVEPTDFARARRQSLTGHFEALENVDSLADAISRGTTYLGEPSMAWRETEYLLAVTPEDLSRVVQQWLQPHQQAKITVVPK